MALLAVILTILLPACGYRYHLPGHTPNQAASVTLKVGEKVPVLSEGVIPLKFGRQLSLSSENPSIADVQFQNGNPEVANIWLVGRSPGSTVLHYGDLYTQTLAFAETESKRLGVTLPVIPEELRKGAGTGWMRQVWLRTNSERAFQVNVVP